MKLPIDSESLLNTFSRSSDLRRKWAAVYLLERVQRVCKHEYGSPFHGYDGSFITCELCEKRTELDADA